MLQYSKLVLVGKHIDMRVSRQPNSHLLGSFFKVTEVFHGLLSPMKGIEEDWILKKMKDDQGMGFLMEEGE